MGNPYTPVTVTNYNSNPPSDDGSQTPSNRMQWSTHKTKIGDPLKTAIEAIDTNVNSAIAKTLGGAGVTSTATTYEVTASDQGKLLKVTAAATITTPDATVVGSPFAFSLLNLHSAAITLDGNGSQTINGSPSISVAPGDGYQVYTDGSNWFVIGRKTGVLPRGYISGCTLSNGTDATNDINIAAGVCRDSTNAVDITVAAMSGKQLDANWTAGAAAGMRNSAAGIANGTYHVYAVAKADGTQDIYAYAGVAGTNPDSSASIAAVITALQAETSGADYLYARRIGSIMRVSAAIRLFNQYGDEVEFVTPSRDANTNALSTSAQDFTLSTPLGLRLRARLDIAVSHASSFAMVYLRPNEATVTDSAPSVTDAPGATLRSMVAGTPTAGQATVRTNLSAQITARSDTSSTFFMGTTISYTDTRGRDA